MTRTAHNMRYARLLPIALVLLVLCSMGLAQTPRATPPGQSFQITNCSETVQANVPGATYTVMNELLYGQSDCIDVSASGITINLNGQTIMGGTCDCTVISVAKGANGVHIFGGGTIEGRTPNYGIHDMGSFALIENVTVRVESAAGILLDTVQGSVVNSVTVSGAFGLGAGIQLLDTSDSLVENSFANGNGYPPCEDGEPCGGSAAAGISVGDSGSQPLSRNNVIVNNQANNNIPWGIFVGGTRNFVASNTANGNNDGGFVDDGWGIYVSGSDNELIDNSASGNSAYDLYDSNTNCGTDRWVLNTYSTHNQPCVR